MPRWLRPRRHARDPVKVNLLLRGFVAPPSPATARWSRGRWRRKRALFISSPIGLGHARRDVAVADELRKLHPDLEIRQHVEQNFHVRHRLERYGAGRAMDFATDAPEEIAAAIADEIGRMVQ